VHVYNRLHARKMLRIVIHYYLTEIFFNLALTIIVQVKLSISFNWRKRVKSIAPPKENSVASSMHACGKLGYHLSVFKLVKAPIMRKGSL
jgi:hypothetical protein